MAKRVKPDGVYDEIYKQLYQMEQGCKLILTDAAKKVGKSAVRELRDTSPRRTGRYAEAWTMTSQETRIGADTTIYNKRYYLTHLLENGHALVAGGRTVGQVPAYPHIKRAEQNAINAFVQEIKRQVENGSFDV